MGRLPPEGCVAYHNYLVAEGLIAPNCGAEGIYRTLWNTHGDRQPVAPPDDFDPECRRKAQDTLKLQVQLARDQRNQYKKDHRGLGNDMEGDDTEEPSGYEEWEAPSAKTTAPQVPLQYVGWVRDVLLPEEGGNKEGSESSQEGEGGEDDDESEASDEGVCPPNGEDEATARIWLEESSQALPRWRVSATQPEGRLHGAPLWHGLLAQGQGGGDVGWGLLTGRMQTLHTPT